MFGIGFTELLLIAIIAILFLGPDKLPEALVDMAKFIKNVKKTVSDAKHSLDEEMKIADLKSEALNYKKQLDEATSELKNFKNIDFDNFNVSYDEDISTKSSKSLTTPEEEERVATQVEAKNDTVTFKKEPKTKTAKKSETDNENKEAKKGDA